MPAMLGQVHLQSSTNARVNRAFKNTHDLGVMRETASVRLMSCSQRYSWFHFQFGQQEATHCRSCWGLFSSFLCKPSAAYEAEGGGRLSLGSCTGVQTAKVGVGRRPQRPPRLWLIGQRRVKSWRESRPGSNFLFVSTFHMFCFDCLGRYSL